MEVNLITEDDYARLPSDPLQKFVAFEEICRRNMLEAIALENTSDHFDELLRTSYMTIVSSVAEELGVDGISYIESFGNTQHNLQEFMRRTSGVVAKIRIRKSSSRDEQSVRLANKTKGIIEAEVSKLREVVSDSSLDEVKKLRLMKKIEEFRTELHKERLSYAPAFSALAIIAATIGGGTSFLANAPEAVLTVTKIIQMVGEDKEKEEAEMLRLEGPPAVKLIQGQSPISPTGFTGDDDIPF